MMQRIWLAALLGIVLGIGLAVAPHPTLPSQPQVFMQSNPVAGRLNPTTAKPANQSAQYVLFALIAGLVLGTPFFFLAKRRAR
jgi:uncharacterized membrane-anchored protein YhcB (DUF1043 family)